MDSFFKHEFILITENNAWSPMIKGVMRKDESAAILLPKYESQLKFAHKLRFYKTVLEFCDYEIQDYYRDRQRSISKWLIKPIVVRLSNFDN